MNWLEFLEIFAEDKDQMFLKLMWLDFKKKYFDFELGADFPVSNLKSTINESELNLQC